MRRADGERIRLQIIQLTGQGVITMKEQAAKLGITYKSTEHQRNLIKRELRLPFFNVALITRYAITVGLVPARWVPKARAA